MREANQYFRVYNWAENNRLAFLYPKDGMPAKVGEALDLIERQVDLKQQEAREREEKKQKSKSKFE